MARDWILDIVGASDEEIAHLRLLMRKAAPQLLEHWRLRLEPEETPDLLLVDTDSIVGDNALMLARSAGKRCVVVGNAHPGAELLPRPFKLANVVGMLNAASVAPAVEDVPVVIPIEHNIFDDFFTEAPESKPVLDLGEPALDLKLAPYSLDFAIDEAEARFKRNDDRDAHESLREIKLTDEVGIDYADHHTQRSDVRRDSSIRISSAPPLSPQIAYGMDNLGGIGGEERFRLDVYMFKPLLAGPARLMLPDMTPLTLDPRHRKFYAKGSLCVFEAHCVKSFAASDWHLLSIYEFEDVRKQFPAREFSELQWLFAYLNSGGNLAPHLDPAAMYRIRKPFEVSRDYPAAARVIRELQRVGRAVDLAAATRCNIGEVYNVLNAFDAIGYLERA